MYLYHSIAFVVAVATYTLPLIRSSDNTILPTYYLLIWQNSKTLGYDVLGDNIMLIHLGSLIVRSKYGKKKEVARIKKIGKGRSFLKPNIYPNLDLLHVPMQPFNDMNQKI